MASTNLDVVRSLYPAWERGDYGSTDWAHPDIEFVFADGPTPGAWIGVTDMAAAWREFIGAWEGFRSQVDEFHELDDERVLVLTQIGGRGKTSGVEFEQLRTQSASLLHLRDGKVTRLVNYLDRERALADLGLAPDAGSPSS
jgi:ketosteroid isomerase-like protein